MCYNSTVRQIHSWTFKIYVQKKRKKTVNIPGLHFYRWPTICGSPHCSSVVYTTSDQSKQETYNRHQTHCHIPDTVQAFTFKRNFSNQSV